ncbi:endolytic transglycosylase MltG [Fusobacterium gastrosuis]|uniref:endolytic transglycosylase MltG n=1 Tax=Fusobacterium gastrosuis TaxID=1755100 RepID=UPI001F4F353F|nr:endolytic transglycosylase MltG [Fusobacterium gastrosuis]MDD7410724.1 endolytic transglycosylase MltG [Fusobacteriaceae bacterium]MDY5305214.1 endolytic transglycosylase MltG [Fusobacterium gastrosuis]MDY5713077.1 endolytic transglycosylase MltG [Fusobacterium gastrosuis]
MKKIFLFLFIFVISILIFLGIQFEKKDTYDLILEIDSKKSLKQSLAILPKADSFLFKLYLKYKNGGRNIKAGYYEINGSYNIRELIDILESGKSKMFKFTIIEGSTVKNVFDKLVLENRADRENLNLVLKEISSTFPYPTPNGNFEGYFYPETYLIPEKSSEKYIIETFLKEFLKKFPEEKYSDKKDFYQKLILASIIEREAAVEHEKPIMASVFYNRIEKNMNLAADSTVNFVFNYEKKRIFYKDLEVDSPYNTYKYKGLPPAPIANPTVSSVEAVYNPAKTDYLFFVTKGGGEHFFSKTYREHIDFQNKQIQEKK